MAYIGNEPAENYASFLTQTFSVTATASYTLDHAVSNENDIRLVINNVVQQPGSGKAYTASGTTLTLSEATASTDVMYCVYLGRALQTVNPPNASVGTSQLASSLDLSSKTVTLASNMKNTPAFSAERTSDIAITNVTKTTVLFDNEFYDSSSAYDTSTGKFTPQVAGKYFVNANVKMQTGSNSNLSNVLAEMYKNSTIIASDIQDNRSNYGRKNTGDVTAIVDMNGSSDFVLIKGYIAEVSATGTAKVAAGSTFQAFKIIE